MIPIGRNPPIHFYSFFKLLSGRIELLVWSIVYFWSIVRSHGVVVVSDCRNLTLKKSEPSKAAEMNYE